MICGFEAQNYLNLTAESGINEHGNYQIKCYAKA